jgi:hypothetical protein
MYSEPAGGPACLVTNICVRIFLNCTAVCGFLSSLFVMKCFCTSSLTVFLLGRISTGKILYMWLIRATNIPYVLKPHITKLKIDGKNFNSCVTLGTFVRRLNSGHPKICFNCVHI